MAPKLRFPEFTDGWQIKKFGELFDRVTRKNSENNQNILTISAQHGLIAQEKFFSKLVSAKDVSNYYLLYKNDYAYNKSYSKGYPMGAVKRLFEDNKGVVSTLYICFKAKDNDLVGFYDKYFESGKHNHELEKIAQEGARNHGLLNMAVGDFFGTCMTIPSTKTEQEKIAGFMGAVDDKLASIQAKAAAMHEYKKGVMQALFSGKLRFKDESGDSYPDWEEKRLGDILEFARNGLSINQNSKNAGYRVTRIETISNNYLDINKVGFIDTQADISEYKLLGGDLLFSNINSPAQIGRIVYVNEDLDIYHGMNLLCMRIDKRKANPKYIYYILGSTKYKNYFEKICNKAVNQASINQTDLKKTSLKIPSLEEQQKIADFLTAIDDKIKLEEAKLASAKEFKKALLQRMFV